MVWRLTYKTMELIIYVIVQVYAKIGTYLITCLLYFGVNNQWLNVGLGLFMHNGNDWPNCNITIG